MVGEEVVDARKCRFALVVTLGNEGKQGVLDVGGDGRIAEDRGYGDARAGLNARPGLPVFQDN